MSSRTGPRAEGTDGSDFSHRERVADHYKESVRQKIKVKVCLWFHLFFVFCVIVWIGMSFSRRVDIPPEPFIMAWCISAIPALIGLQALPKNKSTLLYLFIIGVIISGIGPLLYGSSQIIMKVVGNMQEGMLPATKNGRALPFKMAIIAFVIQLHAITVYYSSKLVSAWGAKGEKSS